MLALRALTLLPLVLLALLPTVGSSEPRSPQCDTPAHGQFDFWVGEWTVEAGGRPAGTNRIERILGGCALLETWVSADGPGGRSLTFYDSAREVWHQSWIDAAGRPLLLEGRFTGGRMQLEGQRPAEGSAGAIHHRLTWAPAPEGAVRQLWETSTDGGRTWTVVFDGQYRRTVQAVS